MQLEGRPRSSLYPFPKLLTSRKIGARRSKLVVCGMRRVPRRLLHGTGIRRSPVGDGVSGGLVLLGRVVLVVCARRTGYAFSERSICSGPPEVSALAHYLLHILSLGWRSPFAPIGVDPRTGHALSKFLPHFCWKLFTPIGVDPCVGHALTQCLLYFLSFC